ncbi:MAG: hypothetical protein KF712_21895 [Akkermansiaceae bacterium]|nr:hypothetical protein [Akkermansiaceae bacterium]
MTIAAGIFLSLEGGAFAKTWTDRFGRAFETEFVEMEGEKVVLSLPDGRTFTMAVADLSLSDRTDLQRQLSTSMPIRRAGQGPAAQPAVRNFGGPWPREVRMDGASACKVVLEDAKSGRFVYESPGYRFTADARITDDALRNFSVMFETTRKYARALPLSLSPGGRDGKLDILLFGEMSGYIRAGGPPGSAGCYVPARNIVMVPMESLGLKKGGTGYSLDMKVSNLVLVHELAHQLTPAAYYAPGARGWFSEGLAEYMAATPYSWGYFAPDIHGNSVKAYVTSTGNNGLGGRNLGTRISAPRLRHLFLMDYSEFSGPNAGTNYALGLLVTHYFFHMEGGGRGARMRTFLEGLHGGASGEEAVKPLLGGGTYEKLEAEISAEWAKKGVMIRFGG